MKLLECISTIKQYGCIHSNHLFDGESLSGDTNKYLLKIQSRSIWLTETSYSLNIDVHLNRHGDINSCIISKIDNEVLRLHFHNQDHRIGHAITESEFIESMELKDIDLKVTTLEKIGADLQLALNKIIPINVIAERFFFGNTMYIPKQSPKERSRFDKLAQVYRRSMYDWEVEKLKWKLLNGKERLSFVPTATELIKSDNLSINEVKDYLESMSETQYYSDKLKDFAGFIIRFINENDSLFILFEKSK